MRAGAVPRKKDFKKGIDADDARRKREDNIIELRKVGGGLGGRGGEGSEGGGGVGSAAAGARQPRCSAAQGARSGGGRAAAGAAAAIARGGRSPCGTLPREPHPKPPRPQAKRDEQLQKRRQVNAGPSYTMEDSTARPMGLPHKVRAAAGARRPPFETAPRPTLVLDPAPPLTPPSPSNSRSCP
jgi:hypothetical protein